MQRYTPTFTSASSLVVGMDVHKKTIALCVYDDSTGEVIDERQLPHDMPRIRKYVQKLQRRYGEVRCCYEASSCGFGLQRALQVQGVHCDVIAPHPFRVDRASVSRLIDGMR